MQSDVNKAFTLVHDEKIEDWYNIGLLLGVNKHTLDIIEKDHQSVHRRMVEVLYSWLKCDSISTQQVLRNAVHSASNEKEVMKSLITSTLQKEWFLVSMHTYNTIYMYQSFPCQ